jgi:propionyl-CoA synthetase
MDAEVPVRPGWNPPSRRYILYTSGTTGKPKGVQRDTGGYAVALAASMKHIFCGNEGETYFSTSDIGWVVGHSYIIYGPLIAGMATIMYEGTPLRPDPGIWWQIVEKYKVNVMFSAPTAVRVLKKQDPAYCTSTTCPRSSTCSWPASRSTSRRTSGSCRTRWASRSSTTTGRPRPAGRSCPMPRRRKDPRSSSARRASRSTATTCKIFREDGTVCDANEKGIVGIVPPLPPGCLTTVWGEDDASSAPTFTLFKEPQVYSSFDWGIKDEDGYFTSSSAAPTTSSTSPATAWARAKSRKRSRATPPSPKWRWSASRTSSRARCRWPLPWSRMLRSIATPELRQGAGEGSLMKRSMAASVPSPVRPACTSSERLPKTRSGKMLRRSIQALAEGRDPGDLTTIDA